MSNINPIEIRGVKYPSMKSAAEAVGVSYNAIFKAKKSGALETVGLLWKIPTICGGVLYKSQSEAARHLGVSRESVRYHINKYGNLDRLEKKLAKK